MSKEDGLNNKPEQQTKLELPEQLRFTKEKQKQIESAGLAPVLDLVTSVAESMVLSDDPTVILRAYAQTASFFLLQHAQSPPMYEVTINDTASHRAESIKHIEQTIVVNRLPNGMTPEQAYEHCVHRSIEDTTWLMQNVPDFVSIAVDTLPEDLAEAVRLGDQDILSAVNSAVIDIERPISIAQHRVYKMFE